jgi:hypothetical protein
MGLLNEPGRHHSPDDIIWCIGEWSEDEELTIEENKVGYADPDGQIWIEEIPDGEYPLIHWAYTYSATEGGGVDISEDREKLTSKSKIRVKNGEVDIQSVKVAVAEVLNQCGGWHVFVESLHFEKDGKVSAFLGS